MLTIKRRFAGGNPYDGLNFVTRTSAVMLEDGTKVNDYEITVPDSWSQTATDILAQKYARKSGVPAETEMIRAGADTQRVPYEYCPHAPKEKTAFGGEHDARKIFHRIAGMWAYTGLRDGYFDAVSAGDLYADVCWLLARQYFAPATPQWLNAGLWWAYGITGPDVGLYRVDEKGGTAACQNSYQYPPLNACYLQSVKDNLVEDGGIMDLLRREAVVFKFGGGSGTNFSPLRAAGEPMSGGGFSSGLMSFLNIHDISAGSIKSGGTTRRAARMVCLDDDHPDLLTFVRWKAREEVKVALMVAGANAMLNDQLNHVPVGAADQRERSDFARAAQDEVAKALEQPSFEGEAYTTVGGQNANNSVRLTDNFYDALAVGAPWPLYQRTEKVKAQREGRKPKPCKIVSTEDVWNAICEAAWMSADPGIQNHDTINEWHTCPNDGLINVSNPCGEYNYINETACNLASLNLLKFFPNLKAITGDQRKDYLNAIRIVTLCLDLTVNASGLPSQAMALGSYNYRTLGIGYANLGATLMRAGIPYDSDEARETAKALTAIMHYEACIMSCHIADHLGAFPRFAANADHIRRVMLNHAAVCLPDLEFDLKCHPERLRRDAIHSPGLADWATGCANHLDSLVGEKDFKMRNAQISLLAPTGTIGLLMDCDTTGVEPDFALVKWKKLAGGGYMKIVNQQVPAALKNLGYDDYQIQAIQHYIVGDPDHEYLGDCHGVDFRALATSLDGVPAVEVSNRIRAVAALNFAFPKACAYVREKLGTGIYDALNETACGRGHVEGAPRLKAEHYPVFDCANQSGSGTRAIHWNGHIDMVAAVSPLLSGAVSKTINMPNSVSVSDVSAAYLRCYHRGVKCMSLYRDGSKLSQPLNSAVQTKKSQKVDPPPPPQPVSTQPAGRKKLPSRRSGYTQKFKVGNGKFYMRTGEYPDGTLGEIFIDCHQEGSSYRSLLNTLAMAVSLGLQHGVPLDEFVDAYAFMQFEPAGPVVDHPRLKQASSIVDALFRDLAIHYLDRDDLAHTPPDTPDHAVVKVDVDFAERLANVAQAANGPLGNQIGEAHAKGFLGIPCSKCGQFMLRRTGTCTCCQHCGTTSGCA